jgi:RNA polymerase primary sigma factor
MQKQSKNFKNMSNEELIRLAKANFDNKEFVNRIYTRLLKKNERYIQSCVKKHGNFTRHILDNEDLYNIASAAFVEACDKYDVNNDAKLITYADYWIRQRMTREIEQTGTLIRIPSHAWGIIKKMTKLMNEIKDLSADEYAKMLNIKTGRFLELNLIRENLCKLKSLDECMTEDKNTSLADICTTNLLGKGADNQEELIDKQCAQTSIEGAMDILKPKERDVITNRYGLENNNAMTLEDIGQQFNLTRERIRQIQESALRKLRKQDKKFALNNYVDLNLSKPQEINPDFCFKKDGVSYMPAMSEIAQRVYSMDKEADLDEFVTNTIACAKQNGYTNSDELSDRMVSFYKKHKYCA